MNETKCEFFQLEMLHSRQMEEGVQAEQLTLPGNKIHLNPNHLSGLVKTGVLKHD